MKMKFALSFWLAAAGFICLVPTFASDSEPQLEVISDLDLDFLISSPKIPWGEDVFRKTPGFVHVESEKKRPKLRGIIYLGNRSKAFIDDRVLGLGDEVGDRVITEIGANFVVLEAGDSQIELTLPYLDRKISGNEVEGDEE
jgi:hypothetical protein